MFFLCFKKEFQSIVFAAQKFMEKFWGLPTDDFLGRDLPDRSGRATGLRYIKFRLNFSGCKSNTFLNFPGWFF
jgi:hypothetical protein